jgi:TRAP-type C4-dicarboxylate transport system permease small subunit
VIGTAINTVLSFMGIVLLVMLLWGGWEWMTSGGESKGVDSAKKRISNAIVGLIIIVCAYAISRFVMSQLVKLM